MGRIDVILPDDLEKDLRLEIVNRFGGKKGDLKRAVIEGIRMWIDHEGSGK